MCPRCDELEMALHDIFRANLWTYSFYDMQRFHFVDQHCAWVCFKYYECGNPFWTQDVLNRLFDHLCQRGIDICKITVKAHVLKFNFKLLV